MQNPNEDFRPTIGIITALGIEYVTVKTLMDSGSEAVYPALGKCLLGTVNSKETGVHYVGYEKRWEEAISCAKQEMKFNLSQYL